MGYTLVDFSKGVGTAEQAPKAKPRYRLVGAPKPQETPVASPQEAQTTSYEGKGDLSPMQAPQMSGMDYAADAGRSFAGGLRRGAEALVGMPGDLADLAGRGAAYLTGQAPELIANASRQVPFFPTPFGVIRGGQLPTATEIGAVTDSAIGPSYEPKSVLGEFAKTAGEFAPSALAGPGGVGRKVAMTAIPAIASEAAGQATKGTAAEPLVRATAALVGGGLAAGVNSSGRTVKQIAKGAPSQETVKAQTDGIFSKLRNAGILYSGPAFESHAQNIANKLSREGFRKAQAPRTSDIVDMLAEQAGKDLDFDDLESIRKATGAILREGPAVSQTDKAAASIIMESLDEFAKRAPMTTNGNIPVAQVEGLKKQARELARRNIIARDIEDMVTKSETYVSGQQSGLKNQFANYLRSKKSKGLTAEERQAFMTAAKGTTPQNLLNMVGRFGVDPTRMGNIATMVPAMGAGAAYYNDQPLLAGALLAVGTGAKFAGRNNSMKNAKRAKDVVLAGRDKQKAVSSQAALTSKELAGRRLVALQNAENARRERKPLKGVSTYGRGDLIPNP